MRRIISLDGGKSKALISTPGCANLIRPLFDVRPSVRMPRQGQRLRVVGVRTIYPKGQKIPHRLGLTGGAEYPLSMPK